MSRHGHDGNLAVGCPECIREARALEEIARWAEAPLRLVTWRCNYYGSRQLYEAEMPSELTFTLKVRVPSDADVWDVDEQYADLVGEAFCLGLPESVTIDDTNSACESMEVEKVTIGDLVRLEAFAHDRRQPELFS